MKPKAKNPQGANAAGSDEAMPSRPWKNTKKERSMQIDGLPALRTLEFEVGMLRSLLMPKPWAHLLYSRHYTLAKNRWIGFERVARAALRDGYTPEDASRLLLSVHAECAPEGYRFTPACAAWIVASQCDARKSWVIRPATAKSPRIVGVLS